jgi:hypothetical protein
MERAFTAKTFTGNALVDSEFRIHERVPFLEEFCNNNFGDCLAKYE